MTRGSAMKLPDTLWTPHWNSIDEYGWVSRYLNGQLIFRKRYYKSKQLTSKAARQANYSLKRFLRTRKGKGKV